MNLEQDIIVMCQRAKTASFSLSVTTTEEKNKALIEVCNSLKICEDNILFENQKDVLAAEQNHISSAMIDRLRLTPERLDDMISAVKNLISLKDPVGAVLEKWKRPNGLEIEKVAVPIGVIGIIYEARPNVTVDAAMLCLKTSNAVILRGGKEAFYSNIALIEAIKLGLSKTQLPPYSVQYLPTIDRAATDILLKQDRYIDLIIPRGGESLIRAVVEKSTIPVIKHYKGVCHIFIDQFADIQKVFPIVENAKSQRPSACNALETLLIDNNFFAQHGAQLKSFLDDKKIKVYGCNRWQSLAPECELSTETQLRNEFLSNAMNVKIVNSLQEAIEHINHYGSGHSDCILTEDKQRAECFLSKVQSAVVYHNASTRFTDGGEFGFSAEIGISTDKLHARGPMGLKELCSYQYRIRANGQIRT